jgi:hypothetical protein
MNKENKIRFEITTRYCEHDIDFSEDYAEIELIVRMPDNSILYQKKWRDWYHDNGQEKLEAVIDCLTEVLPKYEVAEFEIINNKKNDYPC